MTEVVLKYLDHIIEYHDIDFACKILEEYTLSCVYKNEIDINSNFIHALGNLSFIYSKKEINKRRAENFIKEIFNIISTENEYITTHLSNFFEHIMIFNPSLIYYYLNELNNIFVKNEDNAAILYKAVILSSLKNKFNLNNVFSLIKYPWRSYFELSNYHLYYNNHYEALKYIDKAIKSCPVILKTQYTKRQKYILMQNLLRNDL